MDESIAEKLQEDSIYSNDCYTENKCQIKLGPQKHEKRILKNQQSYKWPANTTISSCLLYYTVFSCLREATY